MRWFVGSGFLRGWEAKVRPPTFAGRSLLGIQPGDYLPGFAVFFPITSIKSGLRIVIVFTVLD